MTNLYLKSSRVVNESLISPILQSFKTYIINNMKNWKDIISDIAREAKYGDSSWFEEVQKISFQNRPSRLFKYYDLEHRYDNYHTLIRENPYLFERKTPHSIYNFNEDKIFLNNPFYFNDPWDSHYSTSNELWSHSTSSLFNNPIKDSLRVSCFSENISSTLMWSHYTYDHKGFALEYDPKAFESVEDNFANNRNLSENLLPIIYSNIPFATNKLLDQENGEPLHFKEYLNNSMLQIACSMFKSLDWGYEQEWRISIPHERAEAPRIRGGSAIGKIKDLTQYFTIPSKALYLGNRINTWNAMHLIAIAHEKNIPTYFMEASPQKYEFLIEPLESEEVLRFLYNSHPDNYGRYFSSTYVFMKRMNYQ